MDTAETFLAFLAFQCHLGIFVKLSETSDSYQDLYQRLYLPDDMR